MLTAQQADFLLSDLCITLGFCLPPHVRKQLTYDAPVGVDEFTRAVFVAEGLNPSADRKLFSRAAGLVAKAYRQSEEDGKSDD
jgi:hypothetical protein